MDKGYLTTFEAAALMSVSPDAVLKWIKSGKLIAYRTPGGHYRIARKVVETLLNKNENVTDSESVSKQKFDLYCWEYNGQKNCAAENCKECLVYKARALNCFEISSIPSEFGILNLFCKTSCEDCEYYRYMRTHN
jgi:excisionase family DNA binding protein